MDAAVTLLNRAISIGLDDGCLTSHLVELLGRLKKEQEFLEAIDSAKSTGRYNNDVWRAAWMGAQSCDVAIEPRFIRAQFNALPESLQSALALSKSTLMTEAQALNLLRRVELATGRSVHNAKDWLERLDEGQKRSIYMSIFAKKTSWAPLADRSTAAPGRLPVEVKAGNVEVVHDLLAQNRNVILLCLHGIPYRPILPVQHYLDSRGLQATTIARSATRLENGDCNVVASAEDMPYQLVRLCKALRNGQQPRLIEIYPDGAYGQSFATMDIGGTDLLVGLGAALLARHGRAALVFVRPKWQQEVIQYEYSPGPVFDETASQASTEEITTQFYRESFLEVLRGDPIDFGVLGRYWRQLSRDT